METDSEVELVRLDERLNTNVTTLLIFTSHSVTHYEGNKSIG